jgi:phosphatidylglycerophosphate synthase
MSWQKRVADLLTISRVFLALAVVGVAVRSGSDGIETVLVLLIVAATFDTLDGYFARRSQDARQTWIGAHDLEFDVIFSVGLLVYLVLADYVPLVWGAAHFLFWMWVFRQQDEIPNSYAILFQAPMYAGIALAAVQNNPGILLQLAVWLAVMFVFARRRFLYVRLPRLVQDFHQNVLDVLHRRRARQ